MEDITFVRFDVIRQYTDYKHFSLCYSKQAMQCIAQGIAWISQSHANYYLSSVTINGKFCPPEDLLLIGVELKDFSMKFNCPQLENVLIDEIRQHEHARARK